ncbi:helicase-associated domain-containing protein [Streptomyces sp. Ac-502]|uniref:helicase-associated domain-containing protein n=1 Tax=Streptomyces sp. Ac-502 TaxID=3342801 RepID=UPI0038628494
MRWALDRGLLVQDLYRYSAAHMPLEVALALRGPDWSAPFDPVPPSVQLISVTEAEVERESAAAATAFAAQAATVLSVCSASPPARLKSGGVGARELARVRKGSQAPDDVVRIVLETAYAAGLLGYDSDRVAPTEAYDVWAEQEPSEQFAVLSRAWWSLALTPSLARDEIDKALPALAGAPPCSGSLQARHGLLAAAARIPAGQGAEDATGLGQLVAWYRPLAGPTLHGGFPYFEVVREAELLGVLARGALSRVGAALLANDADGLAAACRQLLPKAASTARIGADLTAVVTGIPTAQLAALLDDVADRETSGTASVWRFTPASVRRALDAGHTPGTITADLTAVAARDLPQPLAFLIADTARTHGRVRIAPAACVIHGAEPALLAELAAHRALRGLGLRLLAPTVLLSRSALEPALAALRAEGYAAVAETADGTVRVGKVRARRAPGPASTPVPGSVPGSVPTTVPGSVPTTSPGSVPAPRGSDGAGAIRSSGVRAAGASTTVEPSVLAGRLLDAPAEAPLPDPFGSGIVYESDTAEIVDGYAKLLSYSDVRQLAHALNTGTAITVDYVAASGIRTVRTLSNLVLNPPFLEAWCHMRDAERVFTLSRIHGIMPA